MPVRLKVANNAQTTLAENITASQTAFNVGETAAFPDPPFRITIDAEIMEVTGMDRNTDRFTAVLRAQEGTVAAVHNAGATVENRWTAGTYDELVAAINEARTYAP